ncbi:primosomal protein N' [Microbacterium excoecariae]|uniref:primosomal protein N' family DNA-binding protein n=1 Tax=Microbacterium excoecariae TaxID=2715210 RepID=UPI00140B246A|nr:primosomal protein N' [Microbacterium excoecariae]
MGGAERAIARVIVDTPLPQLDRLFDYEIPGELSERVRVGVRVKVPLRSAGRILEAFVVERAVEPDADRRLAPIEEVVSDAVVLPPGLYRLARAVADRAAGSAIDVLRLAIPRRMVRAEKTWLAAPHDDAAAVGAAEIDAARAELAAYPGLAEALADGARVAIDAPPGVLDGLPRWTHVWAAAAVDALARGRSAILAVPDYRARALLDRRVREVLPAGAIVTQDAGRPGPERYAGYLRTLEESPVVVIGNRSAVYAPAPHLGVVALFDDGDPSFEEPLAPYVHARDAALVRQGLDDTALLIGGHTRTSDTERLVEIGFVQEIAPARRESPRAVLAPPQDTPQTGRIPSAAFRAAREGLELGPVLVQVARPGYAPSLVCAECRSPARCVPCGGPLYAPARGATPTCRWCGRGAHGWVCAQCDSTRVRLSSSGSERTADELGRAFPGVRVVVADGAHPVADVDDAPALVVATRGAEPIPRSGYRAVLLLDGDRMLQAPDLRIGESCLRWWSNAAALAAPEAPVHLVGVTGPAARALATWSQPAYARAELVERAPLAMPPAARVARLEGLPDRVDDALASLRQEVPELSSDAILGPVPAPQAPERRIALVRFPYSLGTTVAGTLRAAVVQAAMAQRARARRREPGAPKPRTPANTLAVRFDIPDPEL